MFKSNNNQYIVGCLLDRLKNMKYKKSICTCSKAITDAWGLLSIKESRRVYWCESWHINNGQSNTLNFIFTSWKQKGKSFVYMWIRKLPSLEFEICIFMWLCIYVGVKVFRSTSLVCNFASFLEIEQPCHENKKVLIKSLFDEK